jgi:hypothetical protein
MSIQTRLIALAVICRAAVSTVGQQAKKKIENSEQLPVHSYPVPGKHQFCSPTMRLSKSS